MYKILTITIAAVLLGGCANANYSEYLITQQNIEVAKANAEAARYQAMAEIAKYGDTTTQVAAMMSMQAQGMSPAASARANIQAPRSAAEEVRAWASILVPSATQIAINAQNTSATKHASDNNALISTTNSANAMATAIAQSDNNAAIEITQAEQATITAGQTADAFVNIAGEIQAPAANYTDSNNTYADSYNTPTDSNNAYADSYNDNSDNSDSSNNSTTNPTP